MVILLYNVLNLYNIKYSQFPFYSFQSSIINYACHDSYIEDIAKYSENIYYYFKDLKDIGLILLLHYLVYDDLLNQVIKEIMIPCFKDFLPHSKILKDNNLTYTHYEDKSLEDLDFMKY